MEYRTTEDFVNPIAKGASEKFKEYGGKDLTNEISKSGGYTWEPNYDFKTTNSGSLEARGDIKTYQASRWNDRTTDSWISPLTKGASGKYEDYIGDVGSLIFKDGNPIITPGGGYSYEQNWDYTTTKSGSLEARGDIKTYQASRWNTRTTEDFVNPIAKGASEKFKEYGGKDLTNEISKSGGYTWEPNYDFKTTKSGSLKAREDVANGSYQVSQTKLITPDYDKVITSKGVTGLYSSLTDTSIDTNFN
jgi:hypothetical protein